MADPVDGITALLARRTPPGAADEAAAYSSMIESLRSFLDSLAAARIGTEEIKELDKSLRGWSDRLAPEAVPVTDWLFGRWTGSPNRGQALTPDIRILESGDSHIVAKVRFGEFFMGENGAAHGGAIPLLFDELLGDLSFSGGRAPSRTAYLKTDFRSTTPVGAELIARGWYEREEGRKRFIHGTLHHGDVLCAEARALFLALKPGQP
ncbi:MAG TPA: PaaI family thioesterase [Nocardioidaceae bacterium]|nr:PaaI family thioesterase [Nocardioidaceae bacterium]